MKSFHATFRVMLKHSFEVAERLPHGSAYSYNAFGMLTPLTSLSLYHELHLLEGVASLVAAVVA